LILIKDFFLSLNSWCPSWLRLTGLKLHKWMNRPRNRP
jgi:hypothetical protein